MNFLELTIASLAVWRVTSLLVSEEGPWNIFYKIRRALNMNYNIQVLECFLCTSVWVALPFAFVYGIIAWLAISALAIVIEDITLYFNK